MIFFKKIVIISNFSTGETHQNINLYCRTRQYTVYEYMHKILRLPQLQQWGRWRSEHTEGFYYLTHIWRMCSTLLFQIPPLFRLFHQLSMPAKRSKSDEVKGIVLQKWKLPHARNHPICIWLSSFRWIQSELYKKMSWMGYDILKPEKCIHPS